MGSCGAVSGDIPIAIVANAAQAAKINEAVGALECAKLEFYRRLAGPCEDRKVAENGDLTEYGPA